MGSSADQASQNEVEAARKWLQRHGFPHIQDGILGSDARHFFVSANAVVEYATATWLEPGNEVQERLRKKPKLANKIRLSNAQNAQCHLSTLCAHTLTWNAGVMKLHCPTSMLTIKVSFQ